MAHWPQNVGILALEVYIPNTYVCHKDLEQFDGASTGKYTIGLGQQGMGFCSDIEDICSLSLTAVHGLIERHGIKYTDIGHLQVGTETLLDKSKSVKTVLMQLFQRHGNSDVEGVDCINACYGGTAALFNAVNWIESSSWDGRYAVVVAADIAVYASGPARPTGGAGAIAMLVGPNAVLSIDRGMRCTHMEHVYDFYKPDLNSEYPRVNGQLSIKCFLRALDITYKGYKAKALKLTGKKIDMTHFDYIAFHSPYCKLVQKSFARLAYQDYLSGEEDPTDPLHAFRSVVEDESYLDKDLERAFLKHSQAQFNQRTEPTLVIPKNVGNMYTATLYSCLASLFLSKTSDDLLSKRIGAFSYGSGLAATMYSFTVTSDLDQLRKFEKSLEHLKTHLSDRIKVEPALFESLMKEREITHHLPNRTPSYSPTQLCPGTYHILHVDEEHRRSYSRTSLLDTLTQPSNHHSDCAPHYCPHM